MTGGKASEFRGRGLASGAWMGGEGEGSPQRSWGGEVRGQPGWGWGQPG